MTKSRLWVAHAIIAVVVGMQVIAMVAYDELLPFSPFPMFSYPQRAWRASVINAYAVRDDDGTEMSLMTSKAMKYTFPIDGRVLQWNFERIAASDDPKPAFDALLRDLDARYEAGRKLGRHDGPKIRAVRVYRETWTLFFDAHNVDEPDERVLLAEVSSAS